MNCTITLTYAPEHLPKDSSLNHRDYQLFAKRLRKYYAPLPIRYYMGGEYGETNGRPHYHAALFGIDPHDKIYHKTSPAGFKLYSSPTLDKLWGLGQTLIGDLTFESAAYIARYIVSKRTGPGSERYYENIDLHTGEIIKLEKEYNEMSRNPGLGKHWLEKFKSDVYPHGKVIIRGNETNSPRYYDNIYKKENGNEYDQIKANRELEGYKNRTDNTPERLAAKEAVAEAKTKFFKRQVG